MNDKALLSKAIMFAARGHEGQFDKAGEPYILHCLKVLEYVKHHTEDQDVLCAAVLHDYVEDVPGATALYLEKHFGPRVAALVDTLSRRSGVSYETYINDIISFGKDAILIKMCDIRHNSDIRRLKDIRQKDFERSIKYQKTYTRLKESLNRLK